MNIQWFPGHMTKAIRMMEDNVKLVDVVGYVLDARSPLACFNPSFENIIGDRPCLFLLNKCDLADPIKVEEWCAYFRKKGYAHVKLTATASSEASKIVTALQKISAGIYDKLRAKGVFKPVRCLILGVPNCGKSTIINCLSGRKAVITGDKPGVTKGKQWVRLANGLELLDTPGTLWPKFENESVAKHLCYVGSIKDDVVDVQELTCALLEELMDLYPNYLRSRYKAIDSQTNGLDLLEAVATSRGYVLRGGVIDFERTAKAVLDDFRKGKLGQITFDLPPSV